MVELYHKVVEEVRHSGHSTVSVEQVAEIHKMLGSKQKPNDYLGQTIAWSLWHHLHDEDQTEDKVATAVLWAAIPCLIFDAAITYRKSVIPLGIALIMGGIVAFFLKWRS